MYRFVQEITQQTPIATHTPISSLLANLDSRMVSAKRQLCGCDIGFPFRLCSFCSCMVLHFRVCSVCLSIVLHSLMLLALCLCCVALPAVQLLLPHGVALPCVQRLFKHCVALPCVQHLLKHRAALPDVVSFVLVLCCMQLLFLQFVALLRVCSACSRVVLHFCVCSVLFLHCVPLPCVQCAAFVHALCCTFACAALVHAFCRTFACVQRLFTRCVALLCVQL